VPEFHTLPAVLGGRVDEAVPLVHNAGNAATGGIWRVTGPTGTAVLKVSRPPASEPVGSPVWQTSTEPAHWNYWRREALAYSTGLAGEVYRDAGIRAPALLEVAERPDGAVELWLSDAAGSGGMAWSPARLGVFAQQLGTAQARWVDRVPAVPWLSRDWLSQYLAEGPASRVSVPEWDHPAVTAWSAALRRDLRTLWERRGDVLAVAMTGPATLCHLDVWPSNLIDSSPETTLLDWSFVGEGGLGEDPANLIVDAVTDGLMDARLLPAIDAAVTDGYIAGLHDGGWTGSTDVVRRAIMAYGAAKYSWFPLAVGNRAIRGSVGASSYGQDRDAAAALHRLEGLAQLLAEWSSSVLS
jgi:hypothetical protein